MKGTGTVQRLTSGRWRARLPVRLGRVTVGTHDTQEEAARALSAALAAASSSSTRTLRAWGEIWLRRRAKRGHVSHADEVCRWEQHVLASALADREVRSLQARDVAAYARWLSTRPRAVRGAGGAYERPAGGKPISRSTQRLALQVVRLALADAAIEGWCRANPAADVGTVQGQPAPEERQHLRPAQIAQLLHCEAIPFPTRLLYAVAIYTGLRPGELWALRWGDIDLGARPRIKVTRAVKRDGSEGPPKTAKGRRTVPLLQPARDALLALGPGAADALVFPSATGEQRKSGDDAGWADWCSSRRRSAGHRSRAGLPADLDFYSLRHTCCTALLHGWWGRRWTLVQARAWMGHSSVAVTQMYLHEDETDLLDSAALLDHEPDHAPPTIALALPSVPPAGLEPATSRLKERERPDADGVPWSACGQLLRCVARAEDVPVALIHQVAAAALLELQGAGALAARALGEGPHALAAAIELAGRLIRDARGKAKAAG